MLADPVRIPSCLVDTSGLLGGWKGTAASTPPCVFRVSPHKCGRQMCQSACTTSPGHQQGVAALTLMTSSKMWGMCQAFA